VTGVDPKPLVGFRTLLNQSSLPAAMLVPLKLKLEEIVLLVA
jgi:hypothetical protein